MRAIVDLLSKRNKKEISPDSAGHLRLIVERVGDAVLTEWQCANDWPAQYSIAAVMPYQNPH
jgi:hypothetical protein